MLPRGNSPCNKQQCGQQVKKIIQMFPGNTAFPLGLKERSGDAPVYYQRGDYLHLRGLHRDKKSSAGQLELVETAIGGILQASRGQSNVDQQFLN